MMKKIAVTKGLLKQGTAVLATAVSLIVGVSSLSAYEQDWSDKKLGGDGTEPNSWFKLDGQLWGSYEFSDKKPDRTLDYNGFTLGRATINIVGQGKSGDADGWGYRVMLDSNTSNGGATYSAAPTTNPPTPYLKYAYFQVPLAKGTFIRVGFQQVPTVDGQAGTSLESNWGHRYLDADGKAMWDELGVNSSADAGLGFVHKNDMFGLHLLLANGEGYTTAAGVNAKGTPAIGATGYVDPAAIVSTATAANRRTAAQAIGQGNTASYGLDLYGMFSLTPMKSQKDSGFDLSINFPFRLQNFVGVKGQEYQNTVGFDFTPGSEKWSMIQGDARAKRDYAYGTEIDAKLKLSTDSSISLGLGAVRKVDQRANTYVFDQSIGSMTIDQYVNNGYYYQGANAVGTARYAYLHGRFGKVGFVTRYSTGTGACTGYSTCTMSEKVGTATGNPLVNDIAQNLLSWESGAPSNAAIKSVVQGDKGQSRFKKVTMAVTFMPNERFSVAAGLHYITMTDGSGAGATVYPMATQISGQSPLTAALGSTNTLLTQGILTDANTLGTKNYDRQTFVRMQYLY